MVRILANGEIVQDDDPRVRTNAHTRTNNQRQGYFNTPTNGGQGPQQIPQEERRPEGRSPFSEINQQLVNMGFPRWNLGNQQTALKPKILAQSYRIYGNRTGSSASI
uniref:Family with sequence similarity 241 member B n=1 Tax=Xenopus tropicalis TaxID=8364 RepID=A0A803JN08_XENTR